MNLAKAALKPFRLEEIITFSGKIFQPRGNSINKRVRSISKKKDGRNHSFLRSCSLSPSSFRLRRSVRRLFRLRHDNKLTPFRFFNAFSLISLASGFSRQVEYGTKFDEDMSSLARPVEEMT